MGYFAHHQMLMSSYKNSIADINGFYNMPKIHFILAKYKKKSKWETQYYIFHPLQSSTADYVSTG